MTFKYFLFISIFMTIYIFKYIIVVYIYFYIFIFIYIFIFKYFGCLYLKIHPITREWGRARESRWTMHGETAAPMNPVGKGGEGAA
jgi:hypothetical protein